MPLNSEDLEIKRVKKRIKSLLDRCRTVDKKYTHVSMGGELYPGKFNLNKEDKKILYELSGQAVDNNIVFSIAEKLKDYGPIKVDVDLELSKDKHNSENRLYDEELTFVSS